MRIYPDLPDVCPIPARTKGLPWWKATWNWLTVATFWRLDSAYAYKLVDGTWVYFEKGFTFDGASIPRAFWPLINPDGIMFVQGLLHDYAYRHGCLYRVDNFGKLDTFRHEVVINAVMNIHDVDYDFIPELSPYMPGIGHGFWDTMFYEEGNEINGMKPLNYTAWLALRAFGGFTWNKWRNKND